MQQECRPGLPLWLALAALAMAGSAAGGGGVRGPHHPRGQVAATHTHYRPHRSIPGPHSGHAPAAPNPVPKITQDAELLHDAEHIMEDASWITKEDTSKMTPEELEFHYFKIHDVDNNTKLDGLEILQAIMHTAHHVDDGGVPAPDLLDTPGTAPGGSVMQDASDDFSYFVELIDRVLQEDDLDRDGYLSYVEYVLGRQRDEEQRKGQKSPGGGRGGGGGGVHSRRR